MNMNYEDFNTLLFMAYKQNSTDEGRKQLEAQEIEDQLEDAIGPQSYGSRDAGLAIQQAIENNRRNNNGRGR